MKLINSIPYIALLFGVFTCVLFFFIGSAAAVIFSFLGMVISLLGIFLGSNKVNAKPFFYLTLVALFLNSLPILYLVSVNLLR
jgi:hypothetical protein